MNERIETLAKAAGYDMINKAAMGALGFDVEKFAELIVRECAHLVGGYVKEDEFDTDVKEAYEEITKHFGVEE